MNTWIYVGALVVLFIFFVLFAFVVAGTIVSVEQYFEDKE